MISTNIKNRFRLVWNAFRIAFKKPKVAMTDTYVLAQWTKDNKSYASVRSINSLLGLLVGQIAIVKNEEPRRRINNKKFVDWISSGLSKSLKVNAKNTPPYERFHTRKVKMRPTRKYR